MNYRHIVRKLNSKYKTVLLSRPPTGSNALQGGSDADPHPQPPLGLAFLAGVLERLPDVNVLSSASISGFFILSKNTTIFPLAVCLSSFTWCH